MKRVMIIGGSGSGKSTLATKLGKITGLPVIHGDQFQFKENWKLVPDETRDVHLNAQAEKDQWIIDGNYSATWALRSARADTILFVDTHRLLRICRILLRTWKYHGKQRPDLADGCYERFDWDFIRWTWDYDAKRRPNALNLIENARQEQTAFIFKTVQESEDWLGKLAAADASMSP